MKRMLNYYSNRKPVVSLKSCNQGAAFGLDAPAVHREPGFIGDPSGAGCNISKHFYFLKKRYTINRRTAPQIASKKLPTLNPVTEPSPINDPINPPTNAPAIPSKMVTIIPPGSLPGMMSFANKPTIKPITIQDKIPIATLPHYVCVQFLKSSRAPAAV
jgi:hypothetical protein